MTRMAVCTSVETTVSPHAGLVKDIAGDKDNIGLLEQSNVVQNDSRHIPVSDGAEISAVLIHRPGKVADVPVGGVPRFSFTAPPVGISRRVGDRIY
jgi:hypothetical protein